MGELLAEKARVAEEEAALLGKKASDAEEEIKRLRMNVSKVCMHMLYLILLSQLIFVFPLFLGMVMYANEFETKDKKLQHIQVYFTGESVRYIETTTRA